MTALTPRPGIMKIAPYVPGKDSVDGKEPLAKLSSNESALGPSPKAMAAYTKAAAELHRYPDGGAEKLRTAIGRRYGLDPARIICGCGSDELLNLLIRAYCGPGDELVYSQLRHVYDPEIPVNIGELGLVYDLKVEQLAGGGSRVEVKMTLTAPGCGMGPAIAEDAKSKILLVPGVTDADVRITWEPPWNQQMISEEGKMKLGLI